MIGDFFLNTYFFLFGCNKIVDFEFFHDFKVSSDSLWDVGFGYSDRKDLDSWGPNLKIFVERFHELLIKFVENVNVNFLKRMFGAELIDLMVDFVGDPELFIVFCIIEDGLIDKLLFEFVDDFDSVKIDKGTVRGTAWDVVYGIGLDADFHFDEFFDER